MVGGEVVEVCKKVKKARVAQLVRALDCDSRYFRSSRNVGNHAEEALMDWAPDCKPGVSDK